MKRSDYGTISSFPKVEFNREFWTRSENQRLTHTAVVVGLRSAVIFDPPLWGVFCFQDVFFQLIYHSCLWAWPIQRKGSQLKSIWIKGSFNISKENSKRVSGNHIRSTSKLQCWSKRGQYLRMGFNHIGTTWFSLRRWSIFPRYSLLTRIPFQATQGDISNTYLSL